MLKISPESKLLLGTFAGTFALVLGLGLRATVDSAARAPVATTRSAASPEGTAPAIKASAGDPVAVPSPQTGLMPRAAGATVAVPAAPPAAPLVEPPPGNEDYAPQNNY